MIDLKQDVAVRAVGGKRESYQPVGLFHQDQRHSTTIEGDPLKLAECYRQVGVNSLYLADLDALQGGAIQRSKLQSIADVFSGHRLIIDIGITEKSLIGSHQWLTRMMERHPIDLVVATESCEKPKTLAEVTERWSAQRTIVSLDYRGGQFLSATATPDQWIAQCVSQEVSNVICLDLAAVGTGDAARTADLVRTIRGKMPDASLITGGGIRDPHDMQVLFDAGANELLVASLFLSP